MITEEPSTTNTQVLILAGGLGTRLRSVVQDLPKPMAKIAKKPFLEYLLQYLKLQGFLNVTILTGYRSELIQNYFLDGKKIGMNITYSKEDSPLGTGGAIALAMKSYPKSNYLILNGDTFFSMNLAQFLKHSKTPVSIALRYVEDTSRYGRVKLDQNKKIVKFVEKNSDHFPGLINAGIYFINPEAIKYFPDENQFSIEKDVFEKLAQNNLIYGLQSVGNFIDIGIPESYFEAQSLIPSWIQEYAKKL